MTNPNPGLITDPVWSLWTHCPIPGVKLSGIYANKKGYHNTVTANLKSWPDNYSVKLPLDLVAQNRGKARAIDLTMSDSEMVKWTTRMKKAAEDPKDIRLGAVKEFFGTLDNKTVFGLGKDAVAGKWRRVIADKTHLWHGHTSIFTSFVNSWVKLAPLISVWAGLSFEEWSGVAAMGLPVKHDTGEEVKYWQNVHNAVRITIVPPSPLLTVDGEYGDATAAAFLDFWKKKGGVGNYNGSALTGWLALQYNKALIRSNSPVITTPSIVTPEQVQEAVNKWLSQNLHIQDGLTITGTLTGKATL